MKVLTNTPEKLVLESRYTILAALSWISSMTLVYGLYNKWLVLSDGEMWGIGGTALAFAAVTIYFLRPSIFEFDRSANEFRWVKPGLFKSRSGQTPLDQIQRVRVDSCNMDNGKGYRVLVETRAEAVPFQHAYTTSDPNHHHRIVDVIRNWLYN